MMNKCLYCYESIDKGHDFHNKCSKVFFGTATPPKMPYAIDQMAELAKHVVERSISVPGVQAKLSMSLIKKTEETVDPRFTVVGALGGDFIFKPPTTAFPEMPQNEHLTMRIAENFKLPVVPSSLIRLESGELSYITKRVDRHGSAEKIHMLDMFQITGAFDKYKGSMEKVGKALQVHSTNTLLDMVLFFELSLFCFLTGNNDMHLKNFSMVESASGWKSAPAYDLLNVSIILPQDKEEMALALNGKRQKLKRTDFDQFGKILELNNRQIAGAFTRMQRNKPIALEWIDKSFLSDKMKTAYKYVLESRYRQIDL